MSKELTRKQIEEIVAKNTLEQIVQMLDDDPEMRKYFSLDRPEVDIDMQNAAKSGCLLWAYDPDLGWWCVIPA